MTFLSVQYKETRARLTKQTNLVAAERKFHRQGLVMEQGNGKR